MDNKKYDSTIYLIKRLFYQYIKPRYKRLLLAIVCMLIMAFSTAINAWIMQPVLDKIFLKKDVTILFLIPIAIFINSFIKGTACFYEEVIMKRLGQSIITDIQLHLYKHLIHADMDFLTRYPSGNLISRFTNDINAMKKSISEFVTGIASEFVTLIFLIGIMFYQNKDLAIIAFFVFPLAFYPIILLGKRMRKVSKNIQEELSGFTIQLDETFQNFKIIKSYCREEYEISRAQNIINRFLKLFKKAAYIESASSPIMETLGGVAVALIIWYGGSKVISGETTPGSFFSFITALLMAYKPLKSISQLNTSLQEGLAASKRIFNLIDTKQSIINKPNSILKMTNFDIEFRDVCFSYKLSNDNNLLPKVGKGHILSGLNIQIPEGKTIALVGESGAGKSTILNLLQRFYGQDNGQILIGGVDIADISIRTLRNSIAFVSQEVALFDDTIKENIRYGNLNASEEDIISASMAAAAHGFIIELPHGYETEIGQHGKKLSGGQRQRIAIARAILKNAPILLLDEATSALDASSEQQVRMALEYLKKGRTTIVIAHRLSTIESADIICLVSNGQIIESGSHSELIKKGGAYTNLYQKYKIKKVVDNVDIANPL